MKAILALDQGTTRSRAIVFDRRGEPIAVAQQEFRQIFPQPGWVEHDPEEIFASQRAVAARALSQAGLSGGDIAAVERACRQAERQNVTGFGSSFVNTVWSVRQPASAEQVQVYPTDSAAFSNPHRAAQQTAIEAKPTS